MDFTIEDVCEVLRKGLVQITVVLTEYYEDEKPEYAKKWPASDKTVAVVIVERANSPKTPPVFLRGKHAGSCIIKGLLASDPASLELKIASLLQSRE